VPPRTIAAVVGAAAAAALGALILGEYEFTGTLPLAAGILFGLVIGEIIASVAGSRSGVLAVIAAALSTAGLGWAGWLDSNRGVERLHAGVWVAVVVGGLAAWCRVAGIPRVRR
jgi:hypothetical protein